MAGSVKGRGAAFSQRFSARESHLGDTLQRRDGSYPNANCLRPGDEASIICSPLPVCLYFYRRYRFFSAAGQQPNQHHHSFAIPTGSLDLYPALVSAKPGGDRY